MQHQTTDNLDQSNQTSPKPKIIGLYGIPGTGKTYLIRQLQERLSHAHFAFSEGSEVVDKLVPGGLPAFKSASDDAKVDWRRKAIFNIKNQCAASGKVGIVTGHFVLGATADHLGSEVWTAADAEAYTHILYLGVEAELVAERRQQDHTRPDCSQLSASRLRDWQIHEQVELRRLCREHNSLSGISDPSITLRLVDLLNDFRE